MVAHRPARSKGDAQPGLDSVQKPFPRIELHAYIQVFDLAARVGQRLLYDSTGSRPELTSQQRLGLQLGKRDPATGSLVA